MNCTNDNEMYSFHTDGAYVLLGDGHVYFLRPTVTPWFIAAMVSQSGGEPISVD
jgi:prepilin-type processing-associated H-X9-DG protein